MKNTNENLTDVVLKPIGMVHTDSTEIPRHWRVSTLKGILEIQEKYHDGLKDLAPGQDIIVLFHFHECPPFSLDALIQHPKHHPRPRGVFSICSPQRPNPIGMSVLRVLEVNSCCIKVDRLDMRDGTPILDIKPYLVVESD